MNTGTKTSTNQYKNKELIELWCGKKTPLQSEIDKIYELMKDTIEFFEFYNINYHIIAGSALGQARNGGLIPYDDDVDFGIHKDDYEKVWKNRDFFIKKNYKIEKSEIGIKLGTGSITQDAILKKDINNTIIGPCKPFTGINQDIFLFEEDGEIDNMPVMKYCCERARLTWPDEVIPREAWFCPEKGSFGGLTVNVLPKKYLNWYLEKSYGPFWRTHNGKGDKLENIDCAMHSSMKF
tara:strand:- start:2962 stop:3672 length:711 start_codon:yes stop_codon:yes gene_type:complete